MNREEKKPVKSLFLAPLAPCYNTTMGVFTSRKVGEKLL
jgi:hypothetical protein